MARIRCRTTARTDEASSEQVDQAFWVYQETQDMRQAEDVGPSPTQRWDSCTGSMYSVSYPLSSMVASAPM